LEEEEVLVAMRVSIFNTFWLCLGVGFWRRRNGRGKLNKILTLSNCYSIGTGYVRMENLEEKGKGGLIFHFK